VSVVTYFQVLSAILGTLALIILPRFCSCLSYQLETWTLADIQDDEVACPLYNAWLTVLTVSAIMHMVDLINAVVFLVYLLHETNDSTSILTSESGWKKVLTCLLACCSSLSCCILGGPKAIQNDLSDITFLLSNFFNSNNILDVTPSDIAAGLIMVRRENKVGTLSNDEYPRQRERKWLLIEVKHHLVSI